MISHYRDFIHMLDEAGIAYSEYKTQTNGIRVELSAPDKDVVGYMGFVAEFEFTPSGRLIKVGVWE